MQYPLYACRSQPGYAAYPIALLCDVMEVSRSGYYSWNNRGKSTRQLEYEKLASVVKMAHKVSKGTYGARRGSQKRLMPMVFHAVAPKPQLWWRFLRQTAKLNTSTYLPFVASLSRSWWACRTMNRRYRPSTSSGRTEAVVGKWNVLYLPFALYHAQG